MRLSFTHEKAVLELLVIMPIVDAFAGHFHESLNIGPVYRIIFFAYLLFLLLKYESMKSIVFAIVVLLTCVFQALANTDTAFENIQQTIKLFTPIEMITLYSVRKSFFFCLQDIRHVLNRWAMLYPISVFVSYVIEGNVSAYFAEEVGVKGFYYATNEISFVFCVILMYETVELALTGKIKNLFFLFVNALCIVLMGTKSGYMTLGICAFLYVFNVVKTSVNRKARNKKIAGIVNGLLYIAIFIIALISAWQFIEPMVMEIFDRWQMLFTYSSTSTLDFLSSGRIRRIGQGFNTWLHYKWWYLYIGWGFGLTDSLRVNTEMDFLDLLFRSGLFGFATVVIYYFTLLRKRIKLDFWNTGILVVSFIMIFFAGHILFYGASGMALGILLIFCINRFKQEELS